MCGLCLPVLQTGTTDRVRELATALFSGSIPEIHVHLATTSCLMVCSAFAAAALDTMTHVQITS